MAKMRTIYSSIVGIETANAAKNTVHCHVLNVSKAARSGELQILAGDGTPLSTTSYHKLAPGVATGDAIGKFPSGPQVTTVYCRITVDAGPDAIRGSLAVIDSAGYTVLSVEAR